MTPASLGSTTPAWALTLAYWIHMLSTVVWIGGLTSLVLLVVPAARRSLDARGMAALLESLQRRLDPLGWFCLAVLVGTGLFQMSASPHYQGFLAITNRWAVAILAKHILFLLMVGLSAAVTWGILPSLQRNYLRLAQGKAAPDIDRLQHYNLLLLRANLVFSVLVLALTALARAS